MDFYAFVAFFTLKNAIGSFIKTRVRSFGHFEKRELLKARVCTSLLIGARSKKLGVGRFFKVLVVLVKADTKSSIVNITVRKFSEFEIKFTTNLCLHTCIFDN
jgi:hypothetical protein